MHSFSDTSPHCTIASPVSTSAPNVIGTSMQSFCVTVKVQVVFEPEQDVLVSISGLPQHVVVALPGCAKGFIVTGTQTVSFWKKTESHGDGLCSGTIGLSASLEPGKIELSIV
ncbi:MAG: hypothetical protein ACI4CT_02975 [Lachnospiraceae bacterium]